MRENTVIKMSVQRMVCTGCGSEANASCNCGVAYVPKKQRAADAIKANPEKSNRAIASELGVDKDTVRAARAELGGEYSPPERLGSDGKSYPVKLRVVDDGEEFNERLAYAQTKDAFIARAAEAEADAMYMGRVDEEVILAAEETAAAWCQLVSKLKESRE